jgi:flavin-dependent dehydrogenase
MTKLSYDALVVGGGIAGVKTAIELAQCGFTTALMEQRSDSSRNDKSLFVDGAKLPADLLRLGHFHPIPNHKLINADRPNDGWGKQSDDVKTGVSFKTGSIHYLPVITAYTAKLPACVDRIEARYISSTESADAVTVTFKDRAEKRLTAKYLIDASGDASIVSRNHSTEHFKSLISDDPLVAWMYGLRATGEFDPNTVYDPIGKDIGGTSWVTPLSSSRGEIIASGVSPLSGARLGTRKATLDNLVKFCERNGICKVERVEKQLGGVIRSEPISLRDVKKSTRVWQIGQAAGMADPLMAEAFSPAYLLPSVMVKFICLARTPADFYNYWRFTNSMFNYDLMLAMLRRRHAYQQRGVVGSSSAIYKLLTEDMSSEAVRRAVSERRIPLNDLQIIVSKIVRDRGLRTTVIELLATYAKTVLTRNILQRI